MEECTPQWPSFVTGGPDNAHQETLEIRRRKKNKVDICIYGFGEKITNKKRNGSVFHTVWSYWLNTRVRIVRLKRKKMRVFFFFPSLLFFSFSPIITVWEISGRSPPLYTRALRMPLNTRRRRRSVFHTMKQTHQEDEDEGNARYKRPNSMNRVNRRGLGQLFSPVSKRQAY